MSRRLEYQIWIAASGAIRRLWMKAIFAAIGITDDQQAQAESQRP